MSYPEKEIYEFGVFRLNVAEHALRIRDGGGDLGLPDKVFQTLCILVKNHGHLVTKDELFQQVWPDSFVEENNLEKCVHAIRQALDEKPGEQKYIETVRKHGYRFVAKVTEAHETKGGRVGESPPDKNASFPHPDAMTVDRGLGRKRKSRIVLFGVGFLTAVFLIMLLSFNFQTGSSNRTRSIAVLPLKPIVGANRDELYEIGVVNSLIHRLSLMKGFVVRPLSATRKYSDVEQDALAAGREQQVDYVLDSSYQVVGGKVGITVQLVNVESGTVEETYKSENESGNIFALQDAVARDVSRVLLTRFATVETSRPKDRGTTSEEAYALYLQAIYLLDGNKRNAPSAQRAIELLDQAVVLDPDYSLAWAGKARAHLDNHFGRRINLQEQRRKAEDAVKRALMLDEDLPEARAILCVLRDSEQECKRAIELDPNSSAAHRDYSSYLLVRRRFDEAIEEIKTAIALDPTSLFNQRLLGLNLYYARRYTEAVEQLRRVATMDQEFGNTYPWIINSLAMLGKFDEAFELFLKSRSSEDAEVFKTIYQIYGWQGVARERVKYFDQDNVRYFFGACLSSDAGDKDKAFEYLERSYQRGEIDLPYIMIEPRLDPLRDDPRFSELVQKIGLK